MTQRGAGAGSEAILVSFYHFSSRDMPHGKLTRELGHLAAEQDLCLDIGLLDSVFVKVLEDDATAGDLAL